jgi:hypothetical protein
VYIFYFIDTLDQQNICQSANVFTPPWLLENDVVLINAKSSVERNRLFPECVIKLGPDPDSTKKTVKLKIESFYITSCGVYLAVEQSPRTFFDTDVSTLVCIIPSAYKIMMLKAHKA